MDILRFITCRPIGAIKSNMMDQIPNYATDIYTIVDKGYGKKLKFEIYKQYCELKYDSYEPETLLLGRKAFETLTIEEFKLNGNGIITEFMGMKIVLDGSDNSFNFKLLCSPKTELLIRR